MNYVISIINPEALDTLCVICAELKLPMTVVMHGRGTACLLYTSPSPRD